MKPYGEKGIKAEVEKFFDNLIHWRFVKQIKEDEVFKKPFWAQVTILIDYIDRVLEEQFMKSNSTGTISAMTLSQLKNRMDGIVAKCDNTVTKCTNMLEKINKRNKNHFDKVNEEFNNEQNDFRDFSTMMMEKNDKKFHRAVQIKKSTRIYKLPNRNGNWIIKTRSLPHQAESGLQGRGNLKLEKPN